MPKAEKVYDISWRHEILGEAVPNKDKIFSIYEDHTDIIVKGKREAGSGIWAQGKPCDRQEQPDT